MKKVVGAVTGGLAKFILVLNIVMAVVLTVSLLSSNSSRKRGTNAASSMARDISANFMFRKVRIAALLCTVVCCLLGVLFGGRFWIGLPTILPLVLSFVFENKSNNDPNRVKNARVVTKGAMDATAAGAGVAGTAIGTAVGNPMLGSSIGNAVSSAAAGASANFNAGQMQLPNPERFMKIAVQRGYAKEGEDPNVVATRLLGSIPEVTRAQLADKAPAEQAMLVVEGKV